MPGADCTMPGKCMAGSVSSLSVQTGAGKCVGVADSFRFNTSGRFEPRRTADMSGTNPGAPDSGYYGPHGASSIYAAGVSTLQYAIFISYSCRIRCWKHA